MISFQNVFATLAIAQLASASLYVTFPVQGDSCSVSQPCQIKWKDSSDAPSTSTLGETTVDLVTGDSANLQLAQKLGGVMNPNTATALTFTPESSLSPTAKYAIRFAPKSNPSGVIFSTYFTITGGSGTGATSMNGTSSAFKGNTTSGSSMNTTSMSGASMNTSSSANSTSRSSSPSTSSGPASNSTSSTVGSGSSAARSSASSSTTSAAFSIHVKDTSVILSLGFLISLITC